MKNEDKTHLGQRLKAVRLSLEMTQKEFGEELGVRQNTIAVIESGKRNTSDQLILSVCRDFNINEEWLRTGQGEMYSEGYYSERFLHYIDEILSDTPTAFRHRFITALCHLTSKQWDALEAIVLKLSKELVSNVKLDELTEDSDRELSIDEKVEEYRRRLLLEKEQTDVSSLSNEDTREMA